MHLHVRVGFVITVPMHLTHTKLRIMVVTRKAAEGSVAAADRTTC